MAEEKTCLIVGVGPGLGAALARRFRAGGFRIAVAARDVERLAGLGLDAACHGVDATDPAAMAALFEQVEREQGPIEVAIYNASGRVRGSIAEIDPDEFLANWKRSCFGGFLLGQQAARRMLPRERGTILFTGATAAVKAMAGSSNFAAGKFGLRAVAESMSRELHPRGIHVCHFNIDGGIGVDETGEARLRPDAIAESYWQVHAQHPSAWSHDLPLRPWVENF